VPLGALSSDAHVHGAVVNMHRSYQVCDQAVADAIQGRDHLDGFLFHGPILDLDPTKDRLHQHKDLLGSRLDSLKLAFGSWCDFEAITRTNQSHQESQNECVCARA